MIKLSARIIILIAGGALLTGQALAGEQATVDVPNLTVKERLQEIERINVTAEKQAEPVTDATIADILQETEALESSSERQDD